MIDFCARVQIHASLAFQTLFYYWVEVSIGVSGNCNHKSVRLGSGYDAVEVCMFVVKNIIKYNVVSYRRLQNGLFFYLNWLVGTQFPCIYISILISIGQDFCFLSLLGSQKINKKLVCKGNWIQYHCHQKNRYSQCDYLGGVQHPLVKYALYSAEPDIFSRHSLDLDLQVADTKGVLERKAGFRITYYALFVED